MARIHHFPRGTIVTATRDFYTSGAELSSATSPLWRIGHPRSVEIIRGTCGIVLTNAEATFREFLIVDFEKKGGGEMRVFVHVNAISRCDEPVTVPEVLADPFPTGTALKTTRTVDGWRACSVGGKWTMDDFRITFPAGMPCFVLGKLGGYLVVAREAEVQEDSFLCSPAAFEAVLIPKDAVSI